MSKTKLKIEILLVIARILYLVQFFHIPVSGFHVYSGC